MTVPLTIDSIPHRPPFRFVDEILEVSSERIATRWRVDPDMPLFQGHYPGNPITPGVIVCEAIFQAGALLITHRLAQAGAPIAPAPTDASAERAAPVLTRIQDARFKRMARPGDTLEIEVSLDDELDGAYFMTGRASLGGKPAVRVEFAATRATEQGHVS